MNAFFQYLFNLVDVDTQPDTILGENNINIVFFSSYKNFVWFVLAPKAHLLYFSSPGKYALFQEAHGKGDS